MLYLILIHHQTTTKSKIWLMKYQLYLILIHHQTTTMGWFTSALKGCISSLFITKPQLKPEEGTRMYVVSHPYSSPNHNPLLSYQLSRIVVSHPYSSPNHNLLKLPLLKLQVVSHPYSSPNHNTLVAYFTCTFVVSHPYSSPNHNICRSSRKT